MRNNRIALKPRKDKKDRGKLSHAKLIWMKTLFPLLLCGVLYLSLIVAAAEPLCGHSQVEQLPTPACTISNAAHDL